MSVRRKLNSAAVQSTIAFAALVGVAFGSWIAFAVTSALLIGTAIYAGDIRLGGRRR